MLKHFDQIIALDVGLEEAILFQYIIELIYHAKCVPTPESMEHQGKIWIRRPCRKIQKDLPFFSCKRIYLAIDRFNMKALAEWKQRSEWEFSRNVSRCIDSMHLGTSNRCILQHRIDASPIYIQQEIQEEKNNTTGADAPAADAAPCDVLNPSVSKEILL